MAVLLTAGQRIGLVTPEGDPETVCFEARRKNTDQKGGLFRRPVLQPCPVLETEASDASGKPLSVPGKGYSQKRDGEAFDGLTLRLGDIPPETEIIRVTARFPDPGRHLHFGMLPELRFLLCAAPGGEAVCTVGRPGQFDFSEKAALGTLFRVRGHWVFEAEETL